MSTTQNATDEPTTNHPIRFLICVDWDRPLTHPKDDAERLRERLSLIPVDGDVTVVDMGRTSVTLHIGTDAKRMGHSPERFRKKVQYVIRNYNNRVTCADDLGPAVASTDGLKRKHIKWADAGKDRPTGMTRVPPEVWEVAKEKAEKLDLEGAGALEPTITTRTLQGGGDHGGE